ncbi:hypothetical protein Cgig2_001010 [Carnegiea gigantea]|uniref:Uncharacterized protein n=1 Tax=Carnegiea gigantea TaxID=171969 RepID=A0A9Q1JT55_9CARY|nr:hypothetical protein Cgig2_001010 [Carnegiea gigantea]
MDGINKKMVASLLETFNRPLISKNKKTSLQAQNGHTMEAIEDKVGQQTPEKCKSLIQVVKEWLPLCEEELKPKEGFLHATYRKRSQKLSLVAKRIQNVVKELKEIDGDTSESKISELESFIRLSAPEQIDIIPPKYCHTKRSSKRIKGGKEIAMEQQQKRMRLCKACGQEGYHDSRQQDNYQGRGCEDYLKF